jgi:uncharacterized membrane protein
VDELIGHLADQAALYIDFGAVILIGLAALDALVRSLLMFFRTTMPHAYSPIRWLLARRLTMGLELMIASDIIRTAIAPSWQELGQLAAIVALRELLNVTLERDMRLASAGLQQQGVPG